MSNRIPQPGERWRFIPGGNKPDEEVTISKDSSGRASFVSTSVGAVTVYADGKPGIGRLEPPAPQPQPQSQSQSETRPKQHDEISLEEWRHKFRSMP